MRSLTFQAYAKVNLHLGIYTQLDERNYHRADSLMAAVDLADEVTVAELCDVAASSEDVPKVVCEPPVNVPAEKNTVYRAAHALGKLVGRVPNVSIAIRKRVPDQAGMGGSSADAAAVLRALCEFWGVDPLGSEAVAAASSTGADVPFFLDPVPTLLVGAGEVVSQKFPLFSEPLPVVLVRPVGPGVSTPEAYAAFDRNPTPPADPSALCEVLASGSATPADVASLLRNNLEPVACDLLPRVASVRSWLLAHPEVLGGQVTGSGSCVFGICASMEDARRVAAAAQRELDAWALATHIR